MQSSPNEEKDLMIAFKAFCAQCSKENISTQPLIKLLSTIYGSVQVAKGLSRMTAESLLKTPLSSTQQRAIWQMKETHSEMWTLGEFLGGILDILATESIEDASRFTTSGD